MGLGVGVGVGVGAADTLKAKQVIKTIHITVPLFSIEKKKIFDRYVSTIDVGFCRKIISLFLQKMQNSFFFLQSRPNPFQSSMILFVDGFMVSYFPIR